MQASSALKRFHCGTYFKLVKIQCDFS